MDSGVPAEGGLSAEKREDIWALLIALLVLLLSVISPGGIYTLFKKTLYLL